jgi:hypothetical protein
MCQSWPRRVYYLRRAWSVGDAWFLVGINPTIGLSPVSIRKCDCAIRKVRGVCYGPRKEPRPGNGRYTVEWVPREDFPVAAITGQFGITITGSSLEPIAYDRQVILVGERLQEYAAVPKGSLAAVETEDEHVGNVVKRVYPRGRNWVLLSPNRPPRPDRGR